MKRKVQLNDYESMEEYMGFVERSNYQMVELVDNILAYSQLDQKKKLKKELVDIQSIIDDVNDLSSNALSAKQVVISSDSLPKIYCNPFLIKIVIKNIIENGLKYNESEQPTVHISAEQTETHLKLQFKDNGIGVPKEYQEKIFDMFTRLNNRSEYTGSGMGLAFCKKMLDNNNGTISIESEVGKGSTFTVCISTEEVAEPVLVG